MIYETIKLDHQDSVCFLQIHRPEANNTINAQLVAEMTDALSFCEDRATVVVLSGTPEVFCFGADFKVIAGGGSSSFAEFDGPGPLYDLWLRLATGPYVTVAHVRGKANAGGLGFVAASDVVIADETAVFSLSELLFGLYPACVFPFLMRRVGLQKAHYLTLMTQPIVAKEAYDMGLVDAYDANSALLVRRHLMRLRRLSGTAVRRYKAYLGRIGTPLASLKETAVAGNLETFTDPQNLQAVTRYVQHGLFPWETV